jgi:hypothetical protein
VLGEQDHDQPRRCGGAVQRSEQVAGSSAGQGSAYTVGGRILAAASSGRWCCEGFSDPRGYLVWQSDLLQVPADTGVTAPLRIDHAAMTATTIHPDLPVLMPCSRLVRVNADRYDVFERMHWMCFHNEFENEAGAPDRDPDQAYGDPDCPSQAFDPTLLRSRH